MRRLSYNEYNEASDCSVAMDNGLKFKTSTYSSAKHCP